jgi:hypothetical protein
VPNNTSSQNTCQSLSNTYADWLRKFEPYGWFVTATFKCEVTEDLGVRQYLKWIRKLNEELFGRRYKEKGLGITHVRATERQKRGVIHFHALLGADVLKLRRKSCEAAWESQSYNTNGYMRIIPYDASRGAVRYLGKYVSKEGNLDIFLSPILYKRIVNPYPYLQGMNPP